MSLEKAVLTWIPQLLDTGRYLFLQVVANGLFFVTFCYAHCLPSNSTCM